MLYSKFIRLIEDNAEKLTQNWIKEVQNNPATPGYKKLSRDVLEKRIFDVYKRLGNWVLHYDPTDKKTTEHYIRLGRERAAEGIPLSEVTYTIILSRVIVWRFIEHEGVIESTFDLQQALEFFRRVNRFFDKITYLVSVGHESYKNVEEDELHKGEFFDKTFKSVMNWIIK